MEKLLAKIFSKIKKTPSNTEIYQDLYFMCKETLKQDEILAIKYTLDFFQILSKIKL